MHLRKGDLHCVHQCPRKLVYAHMNSVYFIYQLRQYSSMEPPKHKIKTGVNQTEKVASSESLECIRERKNWRESASVPGLLDQFLVLLVFSPEVLYVPEVA